MKVVHVITSLTTGGAERQLEMLVNRSHHRSAVIALYEGGPVADSLRASGHPVRILGMRGWRKAAAWPRLAWLLRRYHADVVHVHLLAGQLWAIPAARLAGVKVVVSTEHSLMQDTVEGRAHSRGLRLLYRGLEALSTHTIAVSAITAARLGRWHIPATRISVVDNGIDFTALAFDPLARSQVRADLGLDEKTVVIGMLARLDPVKRIDQVLRAYAPRLRSGHAVLIVAGTGPLLVDLQALATELGVHAAVRWLGGRSDVRRVLSAMDVLISASRDETFGMAVIEALGSGLPVVYAQCPALEALSSPIPHAVAVATELAADQEIAALNFALDSALTYVPMATGGPVGRQEVSQQLLSRYGAEQAARKVDAVYQRFSAVGPR